MKSMKKIGAGLFLLAALTVGFTSTASAVATSYYDFYGWHAGGSFPTTKYSGKWTTNSTNNTVSIKGWQDTYDTRIVADIEYAVVEEEWFGWGDHWVHKRMTGNYKQANSAYWYTHSFTGVPNGINAAIMQKIYNGNATDGAGNAYQS